MQRSINMLKQSTKNQFPEAKAVGDVRHVRGSELGKIHAITFGSPCQDFSVAGKRRGMDGERSSLITEAIRLIDECRPDFFIWENVKGTFSSNGGEDFIAIIQAFANLGGYRLEWQLLNTAWFLPQNRERIYLVGRIAEKCRGQVFPISEKSGLHNSTRADKKKVHTNNRTALTQQARQYSSWNGDFVKIKSATSSGYEIANQGDSINYSVPNSETRRGRVGKGKAQTLDTACNQATIVPYSMGGSKKGRSCIGAQRIPEIGNAEHSIRRLTETECERLQGFPDSWTKYGNYDGQIKEVSGSQRYKCLGNAVTVDVVQAVGERIIGATT